MNLIAHRGIGKENTLKAFKTAIKDSRCKGFELDVRLSKDNKIMVIHDVFVDRVTTHHGLVEKFTSEELKQMGILELESVLKLKTNKIILIEIKDIKIKPERLLKLINKYPKLNIYIQSFYNDYLHEVLKLKPNFKVGPLIHFFNKEKSYDEYDFVSLYEGFYDDKIKKSFNNKNIELFLWGIFEKTKRYKEKLINENVYLIVDL